MDILWIYDSSDENLRDKLAGMEFDRAIIDEEVTKNTDVKAHILSRTRAPHTNEAANRYATALEVLEKYCAPGMLTASLVGFKQYLRDNLTDATEGKPE